MKRDKSGFWIVTGAVVVPCVFISLCGMLGNPIRGVPGWFSPIIAVVMGLFAAFLILIAFGFPWNKPKKKPWNGPR